MDSDALILTKAVEGFAATRRRQVLKLALVRGLWVAGVAAFALLYADLLVQLSPQARLLMVAAAGATVLVAVFAAYRRGTRSHSEQRMVARLLEARDDTLQNDLINAIDFEDALKREVAPETSSELMRREIDVATQKLGSVANPVAALKPAELRRDYRLLAAVLALGIALGVGFPHVVGAIVPRYLDPYGDHPPYCATRFAVEPAGGTIDYGEDFVIHVKTSGRAVDNVDLVVEDRQGKTLSRQTMFDGGEEGFSQTLENVRDDAVYYAAIDRGRSKRYSLSLTKNPRFDSVVATYEYPPYTRLQPKTRLLAQPAELKAYAGTKVTMSVTSNRPLKSGPLTVNGEASEMTPASDPRTVNGTFTLSKAGDFSAKLIDIEGLESSSTYSGTIGITPDEKPDIAVVSPGHHSFATPTAKVPLIIEAKDDLGIAKVTLYRNLNDMPDSDKVLFNSDGGEIFANPIEVLDLADLGLRPGDIIDYYVTVTDTQPDSPHTAASPAYRLAIISDDAYKEFMQSETTAQELKDKYDALLNELDDIKSAQAALAEKTKALQEKLAKEGALSAEELKELQEAQAEQAKLKERADELAKRMKEEAASPPIFDIEKDYKKSLGELAERIAKAGELMQSSQESMQQAESAPDAQQSAGALQQSQDSQQKALEELGESSQEFKDQIQKANEDLAKVYSLMADVETFKQLYAAQQDLERQARSLKDVANPSMDQQIRMKELGESQELIRQGVEQLAKDLREHAKDVEQDYPKVAQDAQGIANDMEQRKIAELMKGATDRLAEGNAGKGHGDAKQAMDEMKAMIKFTEMKEGAGSACEMRLRIMMGMNPGATMSQLSKSLGSGMGPGFGMGAGGMGGMSGSSAQYNVYGSESPNGKADKESPAGARRLHDAQADPVAPESLAGSIEEAPVPKADDLDAESGGSERFMESYRTLIEAYFRRAAEEK
ncbi:MAG: hypothetical protein WC655_20425 [Candidatus Hydrogenedentales bacterium]|jgi:hypothetical protein